MCAQSKPIDETYRPTKFEIDRIMETAKMIICALKFQKASFPENFPDFLHQSRFEESQENWAY